MNIRGLRHRWLWLGLLVTGLCLLGGSTGVPPMAPSAAEPVAVTPTSAPRRADAVNVGGGPPSPTAAVVAPAVVRASATPAPAETRVPTPATPPTSLVLQRPGEDFVYVSAAARQLPSATILVALHGVSGEGPGFCGSLLHEADRNGWVVLAPTFRYQNWHDPAAVAQEDVTILRRLLATLDGLPERVGLRLRRQVLLYGFSRGGQIAHRFALAYPDRVLGVATIAAGTYTLPQNELRVNGVTRPLPLPYGTADLAQRLETAAEPQALRRVAFWVAVGDRDNRDADVPAAWTAYIGPNRLARARSFKAALDRLGVPADLAIFAGVDHRETPEIRQAASMFLRTLAAEPIGRRGSSPR